MLKNISADNYTIRPFFVNKSYNLDYNCSGSAEDNPSGIFIYVGDRESIYNDFYGNPTFLDLNSPQEPVNSNGVSTIGVYKNLEHMDYASDKSRYELFGGYNDNRESLNDVVYVLSVSEKLYGEMLEPSTITITDKTFTIFNTASSAYDSLVFKDDGNGNLYEINSLNQVGNVFYETGLIVFNRISSMTDVSASLALTNTWVSISSGSQHLPSGVYIVRIQTTSGATVEQQYSGLFNWHTGDGTANATSEVVLHRGQTPTTSISDIVYLRVKNTVSSPAELQVSTDGPTTPTTKQYQLRFYRVF
jgi:hypothetical protein